MAALRQASRAALGYTARFASSCFASQSRLLPVSRHLGQVVPTRLFSGQTSSQLASFISEEISHEKELATRNLRDGQSPTMKGFTVSTDEAKVTLSKTHNDERIVVSFNVNDTVDFGEPEPDADEDSATPMMSRPDFTIAVSKNDVTLEFSCSYPQNLVSAEDGEERVEESDDYAINLVSMYQGTSGEATYAVSGEVLDANLYDQLSSYLEERGLDKDFAQDLIDFSTHYEHAQYVAFLQKLCDFVK